MSPSGTKCSNIWAEGGHPIVKPHHCSPSDILGLTYTGFLWISIWKRWLPGCKETFSRGFKTCCGDSNCVGITQQRWRCITEISQWLLKRTRPPLEHSKGDDQGNRLERFLRTLACVGNLWAEGQTASHPSWWLRPARMHCRYNCILNRKTAAVHLWVRLLVAIFNQYCYFDHFWLVHGGTWWKASWSFCDLVFCFVLIFSRQNYPPIIPEASVINRDCWSSLPSLLV